LLLDDIRIPEIDYYDGGEAGEAGWQAQGFVRTTGGIAQEWVLQLLVETEEGVSVLPVTLNERNQAWLELASGERGVLVVIGASPFTDELALYQLKAGHVQLHAEN
jgi:hypothetical protein